MIKGQLTLLDDLYQRSSKVKHNFDFANKLFGAAQGPSHLSASNVPLGRASLARSACAWCVGPPELAPVRLQGVFSQVLDQPRFATRPTPSLMVTSWFAGICLKVSWSPLGQYTSISTELEVPRPKCNRGSLQEKKLD
jgi:hypothetical protein